MLDLPDLKFYDYHESVGEKKKENLTDDILSKVIKLSVLLRQRSILLWVSIKNFTATPRKP